MHADAQSPAAASDGTDLMDCRRLMRGGSKSFFAASLLLPARVRAPASALYAFCRLADDAIDLGSDPAAAMRQLHARLDALYAGRPAPIAADRALAGVVREFEIPRALLDALLDGFLWDAQGRHYETLAELEDYGARVAGTVGVMMALVMGARCPQALALAGELGVAMQLTNIARDVGEDARNRRLYLPRRWLREAGVEVEAWLQAPCFDPGLAHVTGRLLDRADALYRSAEAGIALLPRDCRAAICAARLVYAEIGHQLRRSGLDSVGQRTVVSGRRKLALMARAAAAALPGAARPAPAPGLRAVQYLVDAVPARPDGTAPNGSGTPARPRRSFDERLVWVIDLFERQAAERQAAHGRALR